METIFQVIKKDLKIWVRNPQFMVVTFISPLLFLALMVAIFGSNTKFPVALVVKDQGAMGQALAASLRQDPKWQIVTEDQAVADRLFQSERIFMVITIPADFSAKIDQGKRAEVETLLNNAFSDLTKNARLRLELSLDTFNEQVLKRPVPDMRLEGILPSDIPRTWYIAVGAILYATFFGGLLNTGLAVSREWEHDTITELKMARSSRVLIIFSKILAGLIMTMCNAIVTYLIAVAAFGLQLSGRFWLMLPFLVLVTLIPVTLGAAIGTVVRRFTLLLPPTAIISVTVFFLNGGFTHYLQLPAISRLVAKWIPFTYAVDAVQKTFHTTMVTGLLEDLLVVSITLLFTVVLLIRAMRRVMV